MSDNPHVLLITLNIWRKTVVQKGKEEERRRRQVQSWNDFGDNLPYQHHVTVLEDEVQRGK